jgi:tetratricopeptide (TPR) repeat protein
MEKLKILFLSFLLTFSPLLFAQMSLKDSSMAYFQKKRGNYMTKNWQDIADAALKIDSTNANIWQLKGMPYLKAGDYENAFKYYDKAVKLNPEVYLTYRAFCKAIFLKDYDSALMDFEAAEANQMPNIFLKNQSMNKTNEWAKTKHITLIIFI